MQARRLAEPAAEHMHRLVPNWLYAASIPHIHRYFGYSPMGLSLASYQPCTDRVA